MNRFFRELARHFHAIPVAPTRRMNRGRYVYFTSSAAAAGMSGQAVPALSGGPASGPAN